ncbi:cytochrome c556 [Roseibium hamelinense]|uniref:Cytochrome c556 n=1 Tax=Roseibium hamelinense TaxID=150831 RepID=A0A562TJN3_9HYPH|nr:cytochrome c [Roseibium hamelinense]MTI42680.1 cytochrome c [Roseibium hamelinense]TWI93306.1 cytochrome c556 [Roseibium hamelinense]
MRKLALALAGGAAMAAAFGGGAATAADDPIQTRKAIMQSVGAAAGLGGGMLKGEIDYTPAAGKAAIATMYAASQSYGSFFPEGSNTGDTTAAPAIWDNPVEWQAELEKFASPAQAAFQAAGREGPVDLDAFKAAFGPVLATCKSCHEGYRVKR